MSSLETVPGAAAVVALILFGASDATAYVDQLGALEPGARVTTVSPHAAWDADAVVLDMAASPSVINRDVAAEGMVPERLDAPVFTGLLDRYLRYREPAATHGDLITALEPGPWVALDIEAPL